MTLIRYPGSKAKLIDPILSAFPDEFLVPLFLSDSVHYVEPFFGSGAIGFAAMRRMRPGASVTIADIDIGIVSLWRAVRDNPVELSRRVIRFAPTVNSFYEFKERDGEHTDDIDTGFRKLALHRISVSGFGYMAGGPIGGRSQASAYTVGCRWRPERIASSISKLHRLMGKFSRLEIVHQSVFDTIIDAEQRQSEHQHTFAYLDPPYFEKGAQLYKHGFPAEDHERLAKRLRESQIGWAASYDDHPEIRRLYADCVFKELNITYSNAVCRDPVRPKNHEVLIVPKSQLTEEQKGTRKTRTGKPAGVYVAVRQIT